MHLLYLSCTYEFSLRREYFNVILVNTVYPCRRVECYRREHVKIVDRWHV
jgi:hypothetical protein